MRVLLVVNPKATATTRRVRDVLADALRSQVKLDVSETTHRGHAVELARQATVDGLDVVVALGGDGTVNEVVNGLLAEGPRAGLPALGVVPAGSTNVFARALGLPAAPVEATGVLLDALRSERRRVIGLGRANERWFTFCAGLGLDAEVVRRVDARRAAAVAASPGLFVRQGVRHYLRGMLRSDGAMSVTTPDGRTEPIGMALVCNTRPWTYLGSRPVVPCPDASFDAGLDLFALRSMRAIPMARHLRQILSRHPRPRGASALALHDRSEFVLRADRPRALQVDGDDLGDRSEVAFCAVPRAMSLAV